MMEVLAYSKRFSSPAPRDLIVTTRSLAFLITGLLLCNLCFAAIRYVGTYLPPTQVADAVREGLKHGTFSQTDYPPNYLIGLDQWTDCLAVELSLSPWPSRWIGALAPRRLNTAFSPCTSVVDFVSSYSRMDRVEDYNRFWHGYATLASAALQIMPLRAYRSLLLMLCYGSIFGAALSAANLGRFALLSFLPLLGGSFVFGQIGQLGASISHSPAFIAIWTFSALILLLGRSINNHLLLFVVLLSGAVEAFLDTMILCPLSAALTIIAAAILRMEDLRSCSPRRVTYFYTVIFAVWCLGFLGTYICKLVMTIAVIGSGPVIAPFINQITFRMGLGEAEHQFYLIAIYRELWRLAYGEFLPRVSAIFMVSIAAAGWVMALLRFRNACMVARSFEAFAVGSGFIFASAIVFGWYTLCREHTTVHSFFMVRVVIVILTSGWCWYLAQRSVMQRLDAS